MCWFLIVLYFCVLIEASKHVLKNRKKKKHAKGNSVQGLTPWGRQEDPQGAQGVERSHWRVTLCQTCVVHASEWFRMCGRGGGAVSCRSQVSWIHGSYAECTNITTDQGPLGGPEL